MSCGLANASTVGEQRDTRAPPRGAGSILLCTAAPRSTSPVEPVLLAAVRVGAAAVGAGAVGALAVGRLAVRQTAVPPAPST
jgi:hypothetical protein